jgi:heat-inducible transcriptional repressor
MSSRREQLLELLIERFISDPRPVSSQELSEPLNVSSATVRNDLVALEEMGLLRQPHTSAGRVPTREAFRAYAHRFIPPKTLPSAQLERLENTLSRVDGEARFRFATQLASSLSGYAVVASLAPRDARLETVLLTGLSDGRVLCVAVLEGGVTRQFTVDAGFKPDHDTLETLEAELKRGLNVEQMPEFLAKLERESASPARQRIVRALREGWGSVAPGTNFSSGAGPVLREPESQDVEFLRRVLELLERPASPSILSSGVNLSVDEPSGVSSVTIAFRSSLGRASLSILGPTRMRYPQAISVAKAVSDALH